jgi:hypothetical protein
MRDAAVESIKSGDSKIQTINRVRPRLMEIFGVQMLKSSDDTINRQLAFIVKQATFLQGQNPEHCHELLNAPGHVSFDPEKIVPLEMANEEMMLMADILRETANLPVVMPASIDEAKLQALVQRTFIRLAPADVTALTQIDFEPARATTLEQKAAGCHFALGIMEEINALPLTERARTFRSVVAEGQKSLET